MASAEREVVDTKAGPLTFAEYPWGQHWTGRADALVAHGLLSHEDFPGSHGKRKTVASWSEGGDLIKVYKTSARRFEIQIHFGPERLAAREARRKANSALRDLEQALEIWPDSAKRFRELAVRLARHKGDREFIEDIGCGYRFSAETWREYEEAIEDALHVLFAAPVTFDKAVRARAVAKYRRSAAEADPAFNRFYAQLTQASEKQGRPS